MSNPAFVVLPPDATLNVQTPLGTVTLVSSGGEIIFCVPPSVRIDSLQTGSLK